MAESQSTADQIISPITFPDGYDIRKTVTADPDKPGYPEPVTARPKLAISAEPKSDKQTKTSDRESVTASSDQTEHQARTGGWLPFEEFSGDPQTWVPADEYVKRAPLYSKIRALNRANREKDKALTIAAEHHRKVHDFAYNKALKELQLAKDEAIKASDSDQVRLIEQRVSEVQTEEIKNRPIVQISSTDREIGNQWLADNPSIRDDKVLLAFAVGMDQTLMATEPDLDLDDRLAKIGSAIKRAYPEKFKGSANGSANDDQGANPRKLQPAMVEGRAISTNGSAKPKQPGYGDLDLVQKSVCDQLVRQGVLTRDQYIKDLNEIGAIS